MIKTILTLPKGKDFLMATLLAVVALSGACVSLWYYSNTRINYWQNKVIEEKQAHQEDVRRMGWECDSAKNAMRDAWDKERNEMWNNTISEIKERYNNGPITIEDALQAVERTDKATRRAEEARQRLTEQLNALKNRPR